MICWWSQLLRAKRSQWFKALWGFLMLKRLHRSQSFAVLQTGRGNWVVLCWRVCFSGTLTRFIYGYLLRLVLSLTVGRWDAVAVGLADIFSVLDLFALRPVWLWCLSVLYVVGSIQLCNATHPTVTSIDRAHCYVQLISYGAASVWWINQGSECGMPGRIASRRVCQATSTTLLSIQ